MSWARRRARRGRHATWVVAVFVAVLALALASTPVAAQSPAPSGVLHVGALLSITGGGSSLGNTSRAALEVARDRWNQQLAKQHRDLRVELDVVDTGQDPTRAAAAFPQLAGQGARIIIGPQSSSEVAAVQGLANQQGVLLVSQGSTASSLAMPNNNVFRFVPNDHVEGRASTDLIAAQGARVIVPMWRDDRGNQGLADSVRAAATAGGIQVTAGFRYEPSTTDYTAGLAAVGSQVAEAVHQVGSAHVAVYLAGFEEVANVLSAALQTPGLASVRWYGGDGSAQAPQLLVAGSAGFASKTGGYPSPLVALPAARARSDALLVAQIAKRAHATPDAFALAAYDGFNVAVKTLLATGTGVDGPTLRAGFARTANGYAGVTGTIELDQNGDRASAPYAYWSICGGGGKRPSWMRTGTWTPNVSNPTGPGHVSRGSCR